MRMFVIAESEALRLDIVDSVNTKTLAVSLYGVLRSAGMLAGVPGLRTSGHSVSEEGVARASKVRRAKDGSV